MSENGQSLVSVMATRFGMLPDEFKKTIKASCFSGSNATDEQFLSFLAIAHDHELSPFTREIYAFSRPGGGIQTIVSIDGWMKIINSHKQFDGMTFEDHKDSTGKVIAITCRMYRKDRKHPVEATEYLAECDRGTEPWKKWPKRMLRHKAAIQAARYAFSFAGIVEPDEFERIVETTATVIPVALETSLDNIADDLPEKTIVVVPEEPKDRTLNADEIALVKGAAIGWGLNLKVQRRLLALHEVEDYEELNVSQLDKFYEAMKAEAGIAMPELPRKAEKLK